MTATFSARATRAEPLCFSKPGPVDVCVYRGDSGRIRVRITDSDGFPVDVTAAEWDCDFRVLPDDPDPICSPTVEPVPGLPNAVDVVMTSAQSSLINEDGVWDLEMTLNGVVTTVLAGKVKLTKDVSRP